MTDIRKLIKKLPDGYSEGFYNNSKYSISKKTFNSGKSVKIYAEELKGNDFISLNIYFTELGENVKPCEMPLSKVLNFLEGVDLF